MLFGIPPKSDKFPPYFLLHKNVFLPYDLIDLSYLFCNVISQFHSLTRDFQNYLTCNLDNSKFFRSRAFAVLIYLVVRQVIVFGQRAYQSLDDIAQQIQLAPPALRIV